MAGRQWIEKVVLQHLNRVCDGADSPTDTEAWRQRKQMNEGNGDDVQDFPQCKITQNPSQHFHSL